VRPADFSAPTPAAAALKIPAHAAFRRHIEIDQPLLAKTMWVCGSTRPGQNLAAFTCRHIGGAADPRHLAFGHADRPVAHQAERLAVATQALVSRRSKATSAYRHRLGERRQVHHFLVPGGELGMARPPRLVGVAEVEIAERTADGDFADRVEVAE
jgi:hypothetical protein